MKQTIFVLLFIGLWARCIHEEFAKTVKMSVYDDTLTQRYLQNLPIGPLRIHTEYVIDADSHKKLIKRIHNVAVNYFYNFLTVPQQPRLYLTQKQCSGINIPERVYQNNQGIEADFGVIVTVQYSQDKPQIAKCAPCMRLKSTNRPTWAGITWNMFSISSVFMKNNISELTSHQFQLLIYIAIHQLIHGLVFSPQLYQFFPRDFTYPKKVTDPFISGSQILKNLARSHYGCQNLTGIGFEDQQTSHWEKQHVGDQLMVAQLSLNPYIGQFTAALFETSQWYPNVNRNLIQPTQWGKNKGCQFFNKKCSFDQYCDKIETIGCTFDGLAIGSCQKNRFSDQCNIYNRITNFQCTDPKYVQKSSNNRLVTLKADEKGGRSSKCIRGDIRITGTPNSNIKSRCYPTLCARNNTLLYLKIGKRLQICYYPNYIIRPPREYQGFIYCPSNFQAICKSKKVCPFGCGFSGICINGKCLCEGNTQLTNYCSSSSSNQRLLYQNKMLRVSQTLKCQKDRIYDPISKNCESCLQLLGCTQCNQKGCIRCNNGQLPRNGQCK